QPAGFTGWNPRAIAGPGSKITFRLRDQPTGVRRRSCLREERSRLDVAPVRRLARTRRSPPRIAHIPVGGKAPAPEREEVRMGGVRARRATPAPAVPRRGTPAVNR